MEIWYGIPRKQFTPYLYIYEDEQAVEHLFRVSCGLDSMVIGETQILGQIRNAFLYAQNEGVTGTWLNTIFKQAITLAKRVHSKTSINENAVSVSYAAVKLGKRIFGSFQGKKVLILGAGKMSELTVKYLHASGAAEVMIVNRTLSRAEELAKQFNGRVGKFEETLPMLVEADIVISATGAKQYVLTADDVQHVMDRRKSRSLFFIDIAVPRTLDPAISTVSNVFLHDIDDLQGIVESNLVWRSKEAAKIETYIADELQQHRRWIKMLGVKPLIQSLQYKADRIHQETLQSLFNKLPGLSDHEAKLIHRLTKSMLNQMLHDPINQIKELTAQKSGDEALQLFSQIFVLDQPEAAVLSQLPSSKNRKSKQRKPVLSRAAVTW